MIKAGRSSGTLQVTILLLVLYIIHLHWPPFQRNDDPSLPLARGKFGPSTRGSDTAAIFQRPNAFSRPPAAGTKAEMRIAIATMSTQETTYDLISISNKFAYARKQNYGIRMDLESSVQWPVWHKLNIVEWLIRTNEFDWVWWLDYDTVITNTSVRLQDVIADALRDHPNPGSIDLILTPDCNPLNLGSVLLRASQTTLDFLAAAWKCDQGSHQERDTLLTEQDCFQQLILDPPHSKKYGPRSTWIPQTRINAFPPEVPCFDQHKRSWKPGDFVAHFAGAWAHLPERLKADSYGVLMRKYSEWIDKTELPGGRWQVLGEGGPPVPVIETVDDASAKDKDKSPTEDKDKKDKDKDKDKSPIEDKDKKDKDKSPTQDKDKGK